MIDKIISNSIEASLAVKQAILNDEALQQRIESAAEAMVKALKNGNRVLFCGNGGSAADAQHLAAELSGRFYFDRPPLNAEAMHCNTSYLTAVANDYGYELIYSRMINGACKPGDILVGISTSGNSKNILLAMEKARELGMLNIAMTGETGGKMAALSDILLNAPSTDTPRIQEAHIMMGHIFCQIVENRIFGHLKK